MVLWKMIKIEELMKSQYQSKVLGTKLVHCSALPQVEITLQEPMTSNVQYRITFKQIIVVLSK